MSTYTPTQIVTEWLDDDENLRIPDTEWGRRLYGALRTLLATVRLNPADARQVETVARALCKHDGRNPDEHYTASMLWWDLYRTPARAVLAALAALGGEQS